MADWCSLLLPLAKESALKSSMIEVAPNVLCLALKRFTPGRFGKLNKKVGARQSHDSMSHPLLG